MNRKQLQRLIAAAVCLAAVAPLLLLYQTQQLVDIDDTSATSIIASHPHDESEMEDEDDAAAWPISGDYASKRELYSARLGGKRSLLQNNQPAPWGHPVMDMSCTMFTCFNYSRCKSGFTIHVYQQQAAAAAAADSVAAGADDEVQLSGSAAVYEKIIRAVQQSPYYTDDAAAACLLVPGVDTLDRDKRSQRYRPEAANSLSSYPHWSQGQNHIIFNLYAGTWPNYYEHELNLPIGKAILAKASFSTTNIRSLFDVSFPLIHSQHPLLPQQQQQQNTNNYLSSINKQLLLSFKGKRYVIGYGSASRNWLHHLHNNRDVILLTTCRHGDNWRRYVDRRCTADNNNYDGFDYNWLIQNSTFCLVPRGRRLGSYRFLEALQAGCIPVLLSNDWELPFSEVIDWRRAVIWADERQMLQLTDIVRAVPLHKIVQMRQQCLFLYNAYFSSVQAIVRTTIEIISDRISHLRRPGIFWNNWPGALFTRPQFSLNPCYFPFYHSVLHQCHVPSVIDRRKKCSLILFAGSDASSSSLLHSGRTAAAAIASGTVRQLFMMWQRPEQPSPALRRLLPKMKLIRVAAENWLSFGHLPDWSTVSQDAVLLVNASLPPNLQQLQFAFSVWKSFPDRLIGFQGSLHYYDDSEDRWQLTSAPADRISALIGPTLMLHRYYLFLYTSSFADRLRRVASVFDGCETLAWSFLVSHVTGKSPLQLQEWQPHWAQPELFDSRRQCVQALTSAIGAMPLLAASYRIDPLFYSDAVAAERKPFPDLGD